MATTKPRLTLSLEPATYHVFKRFAELSGKPTATVIAGLLDMARPSFEQMGVLLQEAERLSSSGTNEHRQKLLAHLELTAHRAEAAAGLIGSDLVAAASSAATSAPAARRASKTPHSLIHTNKPSNSIPARVPAGKVQQKLGGKRAST